MLSLSISEGVVAAVLAAGVVAVLAVLWRSAARRARRERVRADVAEAASARLGVATRDQTGRLRLIRELHDTAIGRVTGMIAQAEGAGYAAGADPSAAVRAVQAIADGGRTTLADMRRVMTLVRDSEAEADPQPRLASARDLLRLMRDAGLQVRFQESGEPYDLDAAADLAVYRILEEAMTNSLQHGGDGTEVRVAFTWTPTGLAVQVEDDGFRNAVLRRGLSPEEVSAELAYGLEEDLRALVHAPDGAGIREMRARAELFGGTLVAEETPGVGFRVAATLPTVRHHNGVHGVELAAR